MLANDLVVEYGQDVLFRTCCASRTRAWSLSWIVKFAYGSIRILRERVLLPQKGLKLERIQGGIHMNNGHVWGMGVSCAWFFGSRLSLWLIINRIGMGCIYQLVSFVRREEVITEKKKRWRSQMTKMLSYEPTWSPSSRRLCTMHRISRSSGTFYRRTRKEWCKINGYPHVSHDVHVVRGNLKKKSVPF